MYKYEREKYELERNPLYQLELREKAAAKDNPRKNDPSFIALTTSISHTYGNVMAFMREWLLEQFPKNMFKTVHVNSKIAHRQLKTNTEFFKKGKPMLIMRPRIAEWSEDRFLKGTMLTERQSAQYNMWGGTNLMDFFIDQQHDLQIKYQLNRSVMNIDCILVFETAMQQMDFEHYLYNKIAPGRPFFINANLESYIPLEMIDIISKLSGVDIYGNNQSTKDFLTYIEGCSAYPISYKLQGSTGNREFFRYYNTNLDCTVNDITHDEGNKTGQISGYYQVTFSIRVEFFTTGFYYLFSPHLHEINLPVLDPDEVLNSGIIPLYTDVITKEDYNLPIGWNIYNAASCILEKEYDSIEIGELFNTSLKEAIDYHRKNGLPLLDFLDIKVRRQGQLIHYGKDYEIDLDNFIIHFKNRSVYYTYRIIVCVNAAYVNELIKTLRNLE